MRKNVRKGLQRLLAIVLTFAMVMTYAGCIGTVEVRAEGYDAICKVKVVVTDKETGEAIENAEVIFTGYYRDENKDYPVRETTRNEDGTYNVPYESEYGDSYYRYYASAPGYKDSRTQDSMGVLYGAKLVVSGDEMTAAPIQLEAYPYANQLETAITDAQDEINGYVNKDDYDTDQKAEIESIISRYLTRIEDEVEVGTETAETLAAKKEILNDIVSAAKAELDAVATSQDNINEEYADCISFVPESGENKSLARKEYGKFEITLSRFEKGKFTVDNDADTSVTWDAKKEMFSINAGSQRVPFEIIDNTNEKGVFFNSKSFPADVDFNEAVGTISDASVTFTKDGKTITVTFDLTITNEDKDGDAAKAVEDLIDALAEEITLEDETAVLEAKAAYDALSEAAKARVSAEKLEVLNKKVDAVEKLSNEAEIAELKEALEKAQADLADALKAKTAAETRATKAEEAQKAAEKKATDAAAAQKTAETKAANAEKAQKDAETKAANAVAAQKTAEQKAVDAVTAQKAAEQKAADAEKKMNDAIKASLPKLNLKVTAGKKKATLSWNKSTKGTGYIIYRSTSKNGTYVKVKTITNLKTTKFTDKNLKSKQRYYYKICVYQGNVNGTLSVAKNIKAK